MNLPTGRIVYSTDGHGFSIGVRRISSESSEFLVLGTRVARACFRAQGLAPVHAFWCFNVDIF